VDSDGRVSVTRVVTAYDCGMVVNPETAVNQIERGTMMALGGALVEALPIAGADSPSRR
jgi:CO/xanthine dehydrogenase Mo-binding subunit